MAINRSTQQRQNYGLGSFVKKITKPFTKVAQKIVPKEIAGIARMVSPFLGPVAGPLAYLAGTAKQKGRISGLDLGIASAPFLARRYDLGGKIRENVPGGNKFMNKLFGTPATGGSYLPDAVSGGPRLETSTMIDPTNTDFRVGPAFGGTFGQIDPGTITTSRLIPGEQVFIPGSGAEQGFLGSGGKMASLFGDAEKGIPSISKTGLTDLLFRKDIVDKAGIKTGKKGLDYLKLAGWTTGVYSAIEAGKYNDELEAAAAAEAAAEADGATDTEVQASIDWAKATFGRLSRADIGLAQGGRVNYAAGGGYNPDDFPLGDPTAPIGVPPEYKPKPAGPVLPNTVGNITEKEMAAGFPVLSQELYEAVVEIVKEDDEANKYATLLLGSKEFREGDLSPDQAYTMIINKYGKNNKAQGGLMRNNYALGTKPEPKENGLGGLPIEADMRYTGGFMPYGKKEKADDVPARLSKNEFVFTADAVKAAGGGSMNEGARKMYQTMKMLEQQNRMMS